MWKWTDKHTVEYIPPASVDEQSALFLTQWLGTVGVVLLVLVAGMIAQ